MTAEAQLFFPPIPAYYGGPAAWRLDKQATGGGVAVDTGSHYIRPLRVWLGEIEEVVAAMERPFAKMEGESLARALLRFRSGVVATLDLLLHDAPLAPQDLFRITGTRGEITIGLGVKLFDAAHRKGAAVRPEEPQGYLLSYERPAPRLRARRARGRGPRGLRRMDASASCAPRSPWSARRRRSAGRRCGRDAARALRLRAAVARS